MSILNRLACAQGRRDEAPNQELARDPAERGDQEGIRELVANLLPYLFHYLYERNPTAPGSRTSPT